MSVGVLTARTAHADNDDSRTDNYNLGCPGPQIKPTGGGESHGVRLCLARLRLRLVMLRFTVGHHMAEVVSKRAACVIVKVSGTHSSRPAREPCDGADPPVGRRC